MQLQTNTNDIGQAILEQYHQGHINGTFIVSIVDPPGDPDPKAEVRDVTLTYEEG